MARALADAVEETLPQWVERSVERVLAAAGGRPDPQVQAAARAAGRQAVDDVGPRLRSLLAADVDEQWANPMSLLREAVRYPTAVLRAAGVAPVERDDFARERFPDDDYDLTPTNFAEVDRSLAEVGIAWGAAKAWEHKRRHGSPPVQQ